MTGRGLPATRWWWTAVAVAVLLCAAAGWAYAHTAGAPDRRYVQARDTALDTGTRQVARLSSVDPRRAAEARTDWLAASTGALHDELEQAKPPSSTDPAARATVTGAALTALDERAGTAELIATVEVETTPRGGRAATDRRRLEAGLTRTADGWKVSALTAVPVAGS
ncbi:hypothetical protein [Streptomyces lichenis]|uniref:Mce-associated membrane protein n=1 Tax=Streptomyces lichenis TaxID=2306967 RepID=A0ABT0IEA4_9ACTN|nr:hypothetical protein [Streptomyces lichenis]MCK8679653.1 hypothetical protein [Streptomyces lichenis]